MKVMKNTLLMNSSLNTGTRIASIIALAALTLAGCTTLQERGVTPDELRDALRGDEVAGEPIVLKMADGGEYALQSWRFDAAADVVQGTTADGQTASLAVGDVTALGWRRAATGTTAILVVGVVAGVLMWQAAEDEAEDVGTALARGLLGG